MPLLLRSLRRSAGVLVLLLACGAALCPPAASAAPRWAPLDDEELARDSSPLDPETGAEILLHEIEVESDFYEGTSYRHYVRARVYSERGIEALSPVEILYDRGTRIMGVEARTVKPDGTVLPLDRDDIYDREVLKAGNVRRRVKSFAPAGLEPGVIVEYRYTVRDPEPRFLFLFFFQDDLPRRHVRYRLRPINVPTWHMRSLSFNCPTFPTNSDRKGYFTFEMHDVPAWKEEPFQLPRIHLQPTALIYYTQERSNTTPEQARAAKATDLHDDTQRKAKVSRKVRDLLATIVSPGDADAEKLAKIHDYCRTRIVNRSRSNNGFTAEQLAKLPENEHATHTLERGNGTPADINTAFVALARAAGFDARLAYAADRSFMLYNSKLAEPFSLSDLVAAVRTGDTWTFTAPGATYLPFGQLNWFNTDTMALVAERRDGKVQPVEGPPAAFSHRDRTGTFTLSADGTLEGDVSTTYGGYWSLERKSAAEDRTETERLNALRDEIRDAMPTAEISKVRFEHATDAQGDFTVHYHLRVPEFAERTGSRLFVQPAVFEKGAAPLFDTDTRKSLVYFDYRQQEHDKVVITWPEGFEIEAGSAPGSVDLGVLGQYRTTLGYTRHGRQLRYEREFARDLLLLPTEGYDKLKAIFDELHRRDSHTITLKREAAAAASGEPVAAPAAPAPDSAGATPDQDAPAAAAGPAPASP